MATAVLSVYSGQKVKVGIRVTESNGNIIISAVKEDGTEFGSGSKIAQITAEGGLQMFAGVSPQCPLPRSPLGNGAIQVKKSRVNQPGVYGTAR